MDEKEYCSTICKARCCKASWFLKEPCPKLGEDNLCPIYEHRLGFSWEAQTVYGAKMKAVCGPVANVFRVMPADVRDQCCVYNPELLVDTKADSEVV